MAYTYNAKKPVLEEVGPAPTAPVVDPYQSVYSEEIKSLADQIANRDPFAYNQNNDPAFKAYAEQYLKLGDRAMQDTIGQGAANTGGIASSYAMSAGAQAKSGYNQQLMGVIPELMDAAYNRYQGEFSMDNQALGSLQGLEDSNYGKYTDNRDFTWGQYETGLGQYNQDRGYNLDVYGNELSQYNNERDFGFSQYTDERDFAYQQKQDAISNSIARQKQEDDVYTLPEDFKPSYGAKDKLMNIRFYESEMRRKDPNYSPDGAIDKWRTSGQITDEEAYWMLQQLEKQNPYVR